MRKNFNTVSCNDFISFQSVVNAGNLNNINSLEIKLEINFMRGKINEFVEYQNSFDIVFKPYDIKFIRVSNHNELKMNQVENYIKSILNKFQVVNTIFCSK